MSRKRFSITATIYDKRGRILSIGNNSYNKSHPVQAAYANKVGRPSKIFLHAEIHAIVKCRRLDKAHRMVVERYDNRGEPKISKPCSVCETAIRESGIKIVEHT